MDSVFGDWATAYRERNGYKLADTLSPVDPVSHPDRLLHFWGATNTQNAKNDIKYLLAGHTARTGVSRDETAGWVEVYTAYWKAVSEILSMGELAAGGIPGTPIPGASWTKVYEAWKEMTSTLIRGYQNYGFEAWTIPCLYIAGKHLRLFAIRADDEKRVAGPESSRVELGVEFDADTEEQQQLRDCEQQLKRIFTLCLTDRAPLEESRKWGIYYIVNLLFKTYFKLNSASLSRTILKSLAAYRDKGDMPELASFPASQRVTFRYYEGVLFFLEENYVEAEKHLTEAWTLCHREHKRNQERILTYLIPCHLLTTHTLPTKALLEPFPRLQRLFLPLCNCIKRGDLRAFDLALVEGEEDFVRHRIYLTLERGRDIALRNLLRKVFVTGGFDEPKDGDAAPVRRTRVPVAEFAAAISLGSRETIDADEVECLLANMIYKNLMKGYIARERGIVVLSKNGAFPGTHV